MLQRLFIERMEHRILVGTAAFLGIMIVIGWVAINENARMATFDRQFTARSIERGAELYAANCSECHGNSGYGVATRGPALNNPYLFGHDFLGTINAERQALEIELLGSEITEDRIAEIELRIAELEAEHDAQLTQIENILMNTPGDYDAEEPDRLGVLGWEGGIEPFLTTTLIHGRPTSAQYWPSGQGMAAWSQTANGPLRDDQIGDLTQYILNWDKGDDWTFDDLAAINQMPINPGIGGGEPTEATVGTDVAMILGELDMYSGDPVNGEALYTGVNYACSSCHMNAAVAPLTAGTWTRAEELRLAETGLGSPEEYIVASIVLPNDYVVPGYGAGVMPQNFGDRMPYQDLADIVAYARSQDQPIE